jgi:hypothetical protein
MAHQSIVGYFAARQNIVESRDQRDRNVATHAAAGSKCRANWGCPNRGRIMCRAAHYRRASYPGRANDNDDRSSDFPRWLAKVEHSPEAKTDSLSPFGFRVNQARQRPIVSRASEPFSSR